MSEDPQIIVTVLGEPLRLIPPGQGWTMDDALLAQEVSGGLGVVEIEQRMMAIDPRAWMALLRVSLARAGRPVPQGGLGGIDILELAKTVFAEIREAVEKSPPAETPAMSSAGNGANGAAGAETDRSSETIHEISGSPV